MTIENARALQEQLANEAIIRQRKNESKELADDCIRSIAIVGKAWGIPADETARRQARAQQEQTWHVTPSRSPMSRPEPQRRRSRSTTRSRSAGAATAKRKGRR